MWVEWAFQAAPAPCVLGGGQALVSGVKCKIPHGNSSVLRMPRVVDLCKILRVAGLRRLAPTEAGSAKNRLWISRTSGSLSESPSPYDTTAGAHSSPFGGNAAAPPDRPTETLKRSASRYGDEAEPTSSSSPFPCEF